ncbi:MAG: Chromosomal replication initiator protein DnaA [Candidatus Moanabacter tarae]|uniref:Chromosomal replication initiator protein DnaA n=1 Tax=Candidatus Moanibacter tarae TaxID=2200854 RepID=A0A2Z4AHE1_9BACT|nr:MAG: Chromosomal replication initiator protein DnaA [Candidatus Moanabacter tarae]|tara:strand:+ start:924 stop:2279 length:1356 start_codon:yes stop_codon:yes gene_type:complete
MKEDIWSSVKTEFRSLFPEEVYDSWFENLDSINTDDKDTLMLGTSNEFAAIWIQDNYLDLINQKVRLAAGRAMQVIIEVTGEGNEDRRAIVEPRIKNKHRSGTVIESDRSLLNPRNTFENFIIGSGNQLAHAASVAVADSPAKAYNPLFLYGETGLGKTHLMHAISHCILDRNPSTSIVYVSCEKFTNEFIRAIQENTLVNFRKFYRNVEVLLIDDIHFLAGKERIQEEFFHTFNELFESQRQVCLSSDRPAGEISHLQNRLVSRFQWGMVTDIQAPDFETRLAILRKKANTQNYQIPNEILEFMAERITRNVRRMEGALISVAHYAKLMDQPLNIEIVEGLLQHLLQEDAQNKVTVEKIQKRVVDFFNLRQSDMVSKRRPSNIAFPRQIAMYLSRLLTNNSLQEIGESFGGRDHGTVIHACKTVENMMEQDETVSRNVDFLANQLSQQNT